MDVRQHEDKSVAAAEESLDAVARTQAEAAGVSQAVAGGQAAMLAELRALAESLSAREQAVEAREKQVAQSTIAHSQSIPPTEASDAKGFHLVRSRRQRLARVRSALHERATKLRRAASMLSDREKECEGILTQRRDLIARERELEKRERKVAKSQGQKRAWALMFYIVGTMGVIGVLSWAGAQQFRPATYAASATIVADGRGRELAESELAEWQRIHEAMVTDAAMLETASQRMKQRGIESLSSASVLLSRLGADLHASSPQDGTLLLELKGEGKEKTRRELETYAVAFTSQSNAGRQRRAGGAAASLSGDVRVGDDPIEDPRPQFAGMFAAGGAVFCALSVGFLWKRLSRERDEFERSMVLDEDFA